MVTSDPGARLSVVFVCTGNRARSPLAEAFLRRIVDPSEVAVWSRGTQDVGPLPPLPEALRAAAEHGIDLSGHRARAFGLGELANADLVVGFEPDHVAAAVVDGGAALERSFTLVELAEIVRRIGRTARSASTEMIAVAGEMRSTSVLAAPSLSDPIGQPQHRFDALAETIESLVNDLALALGDHGARDSR